MKQMFDMSDKLTAGQSDEIYGLNTINWEDSSWKHLSLIGDEEVSRTRRFTFFFRFCVVHWIDEWEPTINNCLGRQVDVVQKFTAIQSFGHNWWWANGIRVEVSPGFTTLQLCYKVQEFLSILSVEPEDFKGRIIFMSMFNDISWDLKTMNMNANQAPISFLFMRKDFHQEDGHSSDLDQKRSGILLMTANHKENGTESQNWRW